MSLAIIGSCTRPSSLLLSIFRTTRRMAHVERTSSSSRAPGLCRCRVDRISDISPSVKLLSLSTEKISFKPGQWVDFIIPDTDLVGGYSICSAPDSILDQEPDSTPFSQTFDLAVKFSQHPPALWVHNTCKIGDHVQVRVGGDVFLERDTQAGFVLLIAGGIGINPLLSMLRAGCGSNTRYLLVYSAARVEELIFREELEQLCSKCENVEVEYRLTREKVPAWLVAQEGRVTPDYVNRLVAEQRGEEVRCFVCGPPDMIDHLAGRVTVKCEYEKWW